MNENIVILAFLAERYPASYTEKTIDSRINRAGLLDAKPNTAAALMYLAKKELVEVEVDPLSGTVVYSATPAGKKAWILEGFLHVE